MSSLIRYLPEQDSLSQLQDTTGVDGVEATKLDSNPVQPHLEKKIVSQSSLLQLQLIL
jgi:hypothetical protein